MPKFFNLLVATANACIISAGVTQAQAQTAITASDVVINGDSFFQASNIASELARLARQDGYIGPSESFKQIAVSGAPFSSILKQYINYDPKPTYLITDGGLIDMMMGCGDTPTVNCSVIKNVLNTVQQYIDNMAAGGTKKFLYMRHPDPQGRNWATLKANFDVLMPEVEKICEASTDPKCLWVDLRPVWEGHYSQYTSDGIHCTSSGGTATAEAFWKAIKENNFFDTTEQPFDGNILVGGKTRTFIVHAPTGLPANPALVIGMHGQGGSGSLQRSLSGFDKVADKGKFIVVYPNGLDQSAAGNGWDISGNSDADFISALIDTMAVRYKINRKRVYATGFSMGGMMSYKLACAMADKIAAIGSASGYPLSDMAPDNCSPARPVPICHIHGMSDDVVPYSGLEAYVAKFVKSNGCPETPTINNYSSSKYIKEYWGPCKEGSEIIVYHVEGMSNAYPTSASQGFSASDTFWAFFSRHPGPTGAANAFAPRPAQFISVGYSAGKIHLQYDRDISAVRVSDVQGKAIFSWKAAANPVHDLAFPVNHAAGGIYLVTIASAAGNIVIRVLIP